MKNQSWWLILIEGIVALALGFYMLAAPTQAWFYLGALAAVFLLVSGLVDFFGNMFRRLVLRSRARRFRGLVGILFGGVLLLMAWLKPGWIDLPTAYIILAIGLIAYGGLGIWVSLFARRGRPMRWVNVLINGLLVLWGLAVFVDRGSEISMKNVTVLVLLIVGALLVVWAFLTRSGKGEDDAEAAAADTAAPAAPPAAVAAPVTAPAAAAPKPVTPAPVVSAPLPPAAAPAAPAPTAAPDAQASVALDASVTPDAAVTPAGDAGSSAAAPAPAGAEPPATTPNA